MYRTERRAGVCRLRGPTTRWLSSGTPGGYTDGRAAYNTTVSDGFDRTDLARYAAERREAAGFTEPGRTLLTGVEQAHAVGARLGPVTAVATAGVSNPAALPMDPAGGPLPEAGQPEQGTVNVLVGVARSLPDGALASLLAVVTEAKAATLLDRVGVPGTTSDAAVVGGATDEPRVRFAGSGTEVGAAARACVREAVAGSLDSRYDCETPPDSVAAAAHGLTTEARAETFEP
ncbi:adenosylcobinamide amidohydrolase [Halosegnis sp.]|uniref:adenosylcobinamide amidohydrolase n=1 Tax=Halosegnis sp. TaxID=2864959 RepID=UPI0035D4AFFB